MGRTTMVFGQMKEPPGARFLVGLAALAVAEYFRDVERKAVLFLVDNVYRHVQAGMEVSGLLGRPPSPPWSGWMARRPQPRDGSPRCAAKLPPRSCWKSSPVDGNAGSPIEFPTCLANVSNQRV